MNHYDVIKFLLKHHGMLNDALIKEWIKEYGNEQVDYFTDALEQMKLEDINERTNFSWKLQTLVEQIYYNKSPIENPDLAEVVAIEWNRSHSPEVTAEIVLWFLSIISFKFDNTQRAFLSICDGDLETYKIYAKNQSKTMFTELFLRFAMCQGRVSIPVVKEILQRLFDEKADRDTMDAIRRMGFIRKDGKINYPKMNAYRKIIGKEELVFYDGLKQIILDNIQESESSDVVKEFLLKINKSSLSDQDDEMRDELLDKEEELSDIEKEVAVTTAEPVQEEKATEEFGNNQEVNSSSNPFTTLSRIIENMEQELGRAKSELRNISSPEQDDLYVKMLEEENKRLKMEIEKEKEKAAKAEEKVIVNILNQLGGKKGNYLLSDLFNETQGLLPENRSISVGRLINLFTELGLFGIQEHTNGYLLGSTFTIGKEELVKQFATNGPITSSGNQVQVRLIHYGWTYHGKVIIQPLVEEIKEEI